uniref:Uncharacterized protein n=1 Tax=Avena sativa TaxID=4498 RepID=A0ACD5TLK8_AVESA
MGMVMWRSNSSAFVPVGRNPSAKKLLNDILFEINKNTYPELDERQLIDKLRVLLKNKRYFIVIDDIWDTEAWEIFKCALVNNCCGSRIITTTRILDVAEKTGEVYRIKSLSNDLSKELFHRRLSGGNRKNPSDLPVKVYDKILHKCGGVPLAIITIGSLLDNKPVEFWSKVYNSIGFGHENNSDVDNTRKILLFSYYDLPCHLRTCLLHMSIYPEDRLIKKDDLIWLWVGEGFIAEEPGVGLFEIGEKYFNELLNKSMLLPVENPDDGFVSGCRLHDIVLDMIFQLAKEENFVTILDSNKQYTSTHTNARRLVIGNREDPLASIPMLQVRSFNAIDSSDQVPSLSCFEVLRVLNIKYSSSTSSTHLEHLGKLVYLRYLGIALENIRVPEEIGYLKFLQVLNLAGSTELPQSISLLNLLKCLKAEYACLTVEQDWIGKLTSLEELWVLNVDFSSNFAIELGKLTELRRLQIRSSLGLGSVSLVKAWSRSLIKLQKIQVIDVHLIITKDAGDIILEGYVPPQQLRVFNISYHQRGLYASIKTSWLPNLSHLTLHVDSPDVEIFGRFPGLVYLSLRKDRPVQGHHVMGSAGVGLFPKLRVYETSAAPGPFLPGAMSSLETLRFSVDVWTSRDGNIEFDFGSLLSLPMLQKVTIWMRSGVCIKDEDWCKALETARNTVDSHPNHLVSHIRQGRGASKLLDDPDRYGV